MNEQFLERLGTVTLEPLEPVVAGATGQWTIRIEVGEYGIDEGGTIKLVKRFASDWERPQFDRPAARGFTTVRTDGSASLAVRFSKKAHERPWMNWCIVIDVCDGSLEPGNVVTIVLGDRSGGSPGIRAQTFVESRHEFRVLVDPTNAAVARRLPSSPHVPIIPGEAIELVCVVPAQAIVGHLVDIRVRGQDRWLNPAPPPGGMSFSWRGDPGAELAGGQFRMRKAGAGRVVARAGAIEAVSNPITITDGVRKLNRYWGDLHAQSDATVGTGTEEEYFTFARDRAFLDFASHQANDFQMDDEDWRRLGRVVKEFNRSHRFVVLPGYEWSGNSPAGGDRNVFYLEDDQPIYRSSYWQVTDAPADAPAPAHPAGVLFERIRENGKAILGAHAGGRYADIRHYFDQETCPLVEVLSCWGVFEWLLWDAFDHGYIVGVMANSDGHKGRPGAEGPGAGDFGIAGGLTCVLAPELTREAIFKALKKRRCYGTSGARIDLDFEVDGNPMGSVVTTEKGALSLHAAAKGAGALEALELYRGKEIVKKLRPASFANLASTRRCRVLWQGARMRGRGRRVDWSGVLRVEGTKILRAETVSFDSPADGIRERDGREVTFESRTTGDRDGIDLWLEDTAQARVELESAQGSFVVTVDELRESGGEKVYELGEIDRRVTFQLYPEEVTEMELALEREISAAGTEAVPYFVKVTQVDGQMAWSSPIYVRRAD